MSGLISPKQPILLIEDSPEDVEATFRSFKKTGLANPLVHCEDGENAFDYLYGRNAYAHNLKDSKPGMILLDLNLPGTDGHEVLRIIKTDHTLKHIPVNVLTTSSDERDISSCYQQGANSYIIKPVEIDGLLKAITQLKDYWFELVVLPKNSQEVSIS